MITNFKIFEEKKFKYTEGDYVKLVNDEYPVLAKILKSKIFTDSPLPSYYTEIINFGGKNWNRSWTDEEQIERKANANEMEDIILIKDMEKYNL